MKKLHIRMMLEGEKLWGRLNIDDKVFWPMFLGIVTGFIIAIS
jgi:hypothetical protein